jgi:hypothetical protein
MCQLLNVGQNALAEALKDQRVKLSKELPIWLADRAHLFALTHLWVVGLRSDRAFA